MPELTHTEGEMVKKLVLVGNLQRWLTESEEIKTLNRLVKKGVVVYDKKWLQWTMKEQNR